MGGVTISEGRIEVCVNHAWGTVCETGFGVHDAIVACTQLGHYSTNGNVLNHQAALSFCGSPLMLRFEDGLAQGSNNYPLINIKNESGGVK